MDERIDNPLSPHEHFVAAMQAVEDAQPSYGAALGRAIAQVIEREQAGENVELMSDPQDMFSDNEAAMRHDLATLQGIDLSPFGLTVAVVRETGADDSAAVDSHIALTDGQVFADFLATIQPGEIDNYNWVDTEDPRWHMRNALRTALLDVYASATREIRQREETGGDAQLSHSTQQFLAHGGRIAQALDTNRWAHDEAERRTVQAIGHIQTFANAGIAGNFLDLNTSGILENDTANSPAAWVRDGPVDERLIDNWRYYGAAARRASARNPELADAWPAQVQRHYEATVRHLEDQGRLEELMLLEGAVGQELRVN